MRCDYSPSFGCSPKLLAPPVDPAAPINPRRQVSLMYGVQFTSKVPLFQRRCSAALQGGVALLTPQQLHKKVESFLREVIEGTQQMRGLLASFQEMEYEMGLSVTRSKKTLSQSSSHRSQESFDDSDKEVVIFRDSSNRSNRGIKVGNKTRASMMRKSNRISIADAINISQLQDLSKIVPLQAIHSSSSVDSEQTPQQQKTMRCEIMSQSSSGDCIDEKIEIKISEKPREKKVSIMMTEMDCSQFDSEIFSQDGEPLSLSNMRLPEIPFDLGTLQAIFDQPCPFLVNLALCLLCKCIARSQIAVTESSVGWLLSTATIVAYKIYYDQPIGGLVDYFASFLGLENTEVAQLERWFLQCVGYQVVVSNSQYQSVLFQLVSR